MSDFAFLTPRRAGRQYNLDGAVRKICVQNRWVYSLTLGLTLTAFGLLRAAPVWPATPREQPALILSIVGINDLHGHLDTLPLLAGYVANLRRVRTSTGGATLLVDAGDMFQGTLASNLAEGAPVIAAYNAMGVAAAAVGNHEFDFGPEGPSPRPVGPGDDPRGALRARARQARFPLLAANVVDATTGKPLTSENLSPSVLLDVRGIPVGLIGVTTRTTASATLAANFAGLKVAPLADVVVHEAGLLRTRGATVVVVLAHAGGSCRSFVDPKDTSSCDDKSEIFRLARALPAGLIDAIVAGHTHALVAHTVAGIPIIETWANGRGFGRIDLILDHKSKRPIGHQILPPVELCPMGGQPETCTPARYEGADVTRDPAVQEAIAPAIDAARALGARALGVEVKTVIARSYGTESALGNLIADLLRVLRPEADVGLWNAGGLRADLKRGPLDYAALHLALPFDNTLAHLRLPAEALARIVARNLRGTGGFLSLSGLSAEARCTEDGLTVTLYDKDGTVVPPDRELSIVTSDFLATGGDKLMTTYPAQIESQPTVRDAIAEALTRRGGVLHGRDFLDRKTPRIRYPGRRPVRCPQ